MRLPQGRRNGGQRVVYVLEVTKPRGSLAPHYAHQFMRVGTLTVARCRLCSHYAAMHELWLLQADHDPQGRKFFAWTQANGCAERDCQCPVSRKEAYQSWRRNHQRRTIRAKALVWAQ